MTRLRFAVVALVLGMLPSMGATETVYFFQTGQEESFNLMSRKKIDEYYRTILSMSSRLQYVSADDARARAVATRDKASAEPKFNPVLDEANNLLWKGKDLLRQKKWEAAIQPLSQALDIYTENHDILRDLDNLVDATFNLALAHFEAQYAENADEKIAEVVVLRPDLAFDRSTVSKGFAERFDAVARSVLTRRSGPVTIDAGGKPVDVYLDGVLRGKAPVTLKDLPAGVHYVQVFLPGFKAWGKRFKAPKASDSKTFTATLDLDEGSAGTPAPTADSPLARLERVPETGEFGGTFRADARAHAASAGADYLLFGYVHKDGERVQFNQFLYGTKQDAVVDAGYVVFENDLSDLQVKVLILEDQLYTAISSFTSRKAVAAVPECYRKRQVVQPAVVVAPVVAPVVATPTVTGPAATPVGTSVSSPVVTGPATGPQKPRFTIVPYKAGATATTAPVDDGPAWYTNKWIWIGVGSAVVLAGAGVGTYFLLQRGDSGSGYKATLTW